MKSARRPFTPDPAQMALWPGVSGNAVNGRGESAARRPSPIYWHRPEATAHGALQKWFYARSSGAAPAEAAAAEVIRQYARGNRIAKALASWLRGRGHDAVPHGGPMAGPITLIPPAIACGMGELGKHGSLIHRRLGANFRLASVLTDVPLIADAPDVFGADEFCLHCRVCEDACPPEAIEAGKQLVRGEKRWYVDFDKCLPYFNETQGCAICIAVCPWSRPGVAETLVAKRARRRART